jgi:hypothetical protein
MKNLYKRKSCFIDILTIISIIGIGLDLISVSCLISKITVILGIISINFVAWYEVYIKIKPNNIKRENSPGKNLEKFDELINAFRFGDILITNLDNIGKTRSATLQLSPSVLMKVCYNPLNYNNLDLTVNVFDEWEYVTYSDLSCPISHIALNFVIAAHKKVNEKYNELITNKS